MASTPPVIFKRSKAKATVRARLTSPENDSEKAEEKTENGGESPSTLATKLKNKIKRAKPKSRLSFGGDEDEEGDGEVFQVKKSNLSRKLALGTHPSSIPPTLDQATISSDQAPRYDAAYLKELKASTPTARPPLPAHTSTNGDAYEDMSVDLGDVDQADMGMDVEDAAAFIPSESSIKVAKEKRDRLRKTKESGEDDFISLSVMKRDDEEVKGPHPGSRLVREEDELGEGDDEFAEYTSAQERIALGKKSRKKEATQRRDAMKELIADAEEEDEETVEWEQEQLRRGGHRTPDPSIASKVKQIYKPAPIPPPTPLPTLAPALARLSQQLAQLTTSHAQNTALLTSLAQERTEVDDREKEMRAMVERAEGKRAWFGGFREWVEGVAGFLDEKYPLLESLEEEYLSLLKERSGMIAKRRREDDEDDLALFMGALPAPPPTEEMEETDDLGRSIPKPTARDRRLARTARRQSRLSRTTKPASSTSEADEGYSTDASLSPPDASAYSSALHGLASRTKAVLADVKAEEFRDPRKGRWGVWRERYGDSYVGAWGGLGVVGVWEFWVRLECVGWDCIEDRRNLHDFKWYKGLYEYSRPGLGSVVEERPLGPDGDLVSSMVTTAVVPMVCRLVEAGALDAYSERGVVRMVDLAEEVEASVESGNVKFQALLKSVMAAFQKAIGETEASLAKYQTAHQPLPAFNPQAIPARRRFLARQVKLLRNLMRWRKYTGERFGVGLLVGRVVEGVMGVAEGGWDVGGEEVARVVANILPVELTPYQLKHLRQTR
ncbi:nineteen complex-related protein 2-domain-containing protein [Crassisporium funariophilum]|nr:nineteen complex-related protein 2-domain-containing protein [Crassisporium funariophilum]